MQSISLLNISFSYLSSAELFSDLSVVFDDNSHVAIIGDNGCGKTTLLKIISGELEPDSGRVVRGASTYLLPQIAAPDAKSGGERQQRELAAAFASGADILLLDEPTNNLDANARADFFAQLREWRGGVIIISHDRELLNQVDFILELSHGKIRAFGGNYDFYVAQKNAEREKIEADITNTENRITRLNVTKRIASDTSVASMNRLKTSKQKGIATGHKFKHGGNHPADKIECIKSKKLKLIQKKLDEKLEYRQKLSIELCDDKIKIPMPAKPFIRKNLIKIENISFGYDRDIFKDFNFEMSGGERVRIVGDNGSGKTTLLNLILGKLKPTSGDIKLFGRAAYLDQNLSLLNPNDTIVENIMEYAGILKHNAHAIAANFGFRGDASQKKVSVLSGGELLKATLAAVLGDTNQPDLIILDEPTNNLDIKSIGILEDALNQYGGAILIISHDEMFVKNLSLDRVVSIND
jgi:ATPase subunit of ABC transporter with duplicated ATPase domains